MFKANLKRLYKNRILLFLLESSPQKEFFQSSHEINKLTQFLKLLSLRDRCLARFSIYLSIYLPYSCPFYSDRNSPSLPQAKTAETNSRKSARHSPSSRYLKPSNGYSMNEVISHKITLILFVLKYKYNFLVLFNFKSVLFNYLNKIFQLIIYVLSSLIIGENKIEHYIFLLFFTI